MKLFALLCVLSVPVFAGTALAGSTGANDGALAVKNTDGRIVVNARGGGSFAITVNGSGIDMSVVGRGLVQIDGTSTTTGTYATNGDPAQPVPSYKLTLPLAPSVPAGG